MEKRSFGVYLGSMVGALASAALDSAALVPMEPKVTAKPTKARVRHLRGSALGQNGVGSQPVPGGGKRERERMLRKIAAGQVKVDGE